jgi:ubiquinone/menaquinone biosynthesis C-methylase UbiE
MTLADKSSSRHWHTCPWWLCFTFDNPVRRWLQNPDRVIEGLVQEGQAALDIGCGMGYFSLPLSRAVGKAGSVICVDLQVEMLAANRARAERAGLVDNMRFQQCTVSSLGLNTTADFALAFWMVHEVRDRRALFNEIRGALKQGGTLLLVEPKIHVAQQAFDSSLSIALEVGFNRLAEPKVALSRAALLINP